MTLAGQFHHEAFFHAGSAQFVEGTSAFVRDALEADAAVLVVLRPDRAEALRSRLDGGADRVEFADMAEVGANPARIIPAWRDFIERQPGRPVRGIGEPIFPERSPAELVECQRHEALLNVAFADTPGFRLLCPYDASALAPDVLDEARRSHPYLSGNGAGGESPDYRGLEDAAAPFADPLPEPAAVPESRIFQAGTLHALRDFVGAAARDAGLDPATTDDVVLAVDEVATNSVVHGGGGGVLRVWQEGAELIYEVQDRGTIDAPLAGRESPPTETGAGRGLWVANQLCDLVQLRSFAGGSAVRLHKRLG